jgi:flagellar protein FlaG
MSFDINAIDPTRRRPLVPERPAAQTAAEARFAEALRDADATVDAIPAAPPPEVMDEVLAAQRAIEDMHDRGRTLHFAMDSGRVKILLQDLDGNVIREVPPSKAVDIARGKVDE